MVRGIWVCRNMKGAFDHIHAHFILIRLHLQIFCTISNEIVLLHLISAPPRLRNHGILQVKLVLGHCLLVVVMKFQDKFASLRQLNSPNSRDEF